MKRGFAVSDMLIALAMLALLAAFGITATAAWRQQERLLARQRVLDRQADSVLEELRAGVRPVRVGRVDLKPDDLSGTAAGTLDIRAVQEQPGVLRCRVELTDCPPPGEKPISVWLQTEIIPESAP